ncbi:MAG TPA: phosphotransferase, partial [Vineibacter sp.]|nr:phosphotransferase [Vineibacter sp.]
QMTEAWADAQARLHAVPVGPVMEELRAAGLSPEAVTFDGRLATLGQAIADANLDGLKPALEWLQANRPPQPATLSVCHGDLHPLNILASEGRVTAVLDWGNVALGDPALDVGSTIAGIATTPFDVPAGLRPLVRSMLRYVLWRYRRAYRRRRAVDPAAVRYYQVFRSLNHLAGALRTAVQGGAPAGAHHLPAARQLLVAHIRQLSGGAVSLVA